MTRPTSFSRPALALAAALLVVGLSGCMAPKTRYSRDGFYGGFSAVGSVSSFDDIGATDLGDSDVVAGIGLRGGFRFYDQFALEVEYQGSDDFEFADGDVFLQSFGVNGKYFLMTGRAQPYALAGIGTLDAELDEEDLDEAQLYYRFGGGIEGYLTQYVATFFELEANLPTGDLEELQYSSAQLGLIFRF